MTGIELDSINQQQRTSVLSPDQHVNLGETTPTIAELESTIRFDLESIISERREPLLVRQLAIAKAAAYFENTYGLIFGSQIEALKRLKANGKISTADAHDYYESTVRPKFPAVDPGITFESWSSFLQARGLIDRDADGVAIKELGREFLRFLETRNLPLDKAL